MKTKKAGLLLLFLFNISPWLLAGDSKPNFTGAWVLDKDKSELGERPEGRGRPPGMLFDSPVIEHEGPKLTVKRKIKTPDGEERIREMKYTTNGKENENEGFQGMVNKSKTHWDGNTLITEAAIETPMGTMETREIRSLSADGLTMTVEMTTKGGPREGTRKLVFQKQEEK